MREKFTNQKNAFFIVANRNFAYPAYIKFSYTHLSIV